MLAVVALGAIVAALAPATRAPAVEAELPPLDCPARIGDAQLRDEELDVLPNGTTVVGRCHWSVRTDGQPVRENGTTRLAGSAEIDVRYDLPPKHTYCEAENGLPVRETEDSFFEFRSLPGQGSPTFRGEFHLREVATRVTVRATLEDGVTKDAMLSLAERIENEIRTVAMHCFAPDPDAPFGPMACPAGIGDQLVLFETSSDTEPERRDSESRPWLEASCRYEHVYRGTPDGGSSLNVTGRWADAPLPPESRLLDDVCPAEVIGWDPADIDDRNEYRAPPDRLGAVRINNRDGLDAIDLTDVDALIDTILDNVAALAAPCPTAAAPTPTSPTPTASPTPGDECEVHGTVTSPTGQPVRGMPIELFYGGGVRQGVTTGDDGTYRFLEPSLADVSFDFDPSLDPIDVRLELTDDVNEPAIWQVTHGATNELAAVKAGPVLLQDLPGCRLDLDLRVRDDPLLEPSGGAFEQPLEEAANLVEIAVNIEKAFRWAQTDLGVTFDYLPTLPVIGYCTAATPNTESLCTKAGDLFAFFRGSQAVSQDFEEVAPFIGISPAMSKTSRRDAPMNREYHEVGHAVMAEVFGNRLPVAEGLGSWANHKGYYANEVSVDAVVEGFAEFFATQVARHVDGDPRWLLYPVSSKRFDLEDDIKPWHADGLHEEFATASLLVDLVDGNGDHPGPVQHDLVIRSQKLIDNTIDDTAPKLLAGEIFNQGTETATDIRVGAVVPAELSLDNVLTAVQAFLSGGAPQEVLIGGIIDEQIPPNTGSLYLIPLTEEQARQVVEVIAVGSAAGDDDLVEVAPRAVLDALAGHDPGRLADYPFPETMTDVHAALSAALPADADADGTPDIDELFIAHGWYGDVEGGVSNRAFDAGERLGNSSWVAGENTRPTGGRNPRLTTAEIPPSQHVALDVSTLAGPVDTVTVFVFRRDGRRGWQTAAERDPDTGTFELSIPAPDVDGVVLVAADAEGFAPAVRVITTEDFWPAAEADPDTQFLRIEGSLALGEPLDGGGLLGGLLALVLLAAGLVGLRRRTGGAAAPAGQAT